MRTVHGPMPTTRDARRIATLFLLTACLGACHRTTPQGASNAAAVAAASAPVAPPAPAESIANATLAVAAASDQPSRAAREQTLRVQRQLVEQQRVIRDAAQRGHANERCLAGQKVRRVANGWVQAGTC